MGADSKISWTHHTFNPWWGCTKVGNSPACDNCYAETWAKRTGFKIWGDDADRRYFGEKHWREPLKWNNAAEKAGERARVFCASMGDWAEGRPEQEPELRKLWTLIEGTQALNWLMLTKRPQLIRKLCPLASHPRIWQGCTAETQQWMDIRAQALREVYAAVKWFSIEPMFEDITLPEWFLRLGSSAWVICGGESGAHARPLDVRAARYLRDQCQRNGVRFHMKQMSGRTKAELEAIPADLMIREYPEAA